MSEQEHQQESLQELVRREWETLLEASLGEGIVRDSSVNEAGDYITLEVAPPDWHRTATFLCNDDRFLFDYVRNYSGVDEEAHLRIVLHLYSFTHGHYICLETKLEREQPEVESLASLWSAANWNEREMYDLLGIIFTNHPNLKRILLPDDWVGHPLRKDYQPLDEGV